MIMNIYLIHFSIFFFLILGLIQLYSQRSYGALDNTVTSTQKKNFMRRGLCEFLISGVYVCFTLLLVGNL